MVSICSTYYTLVLLCLVVNVDAWPGSYVGKAPFSESEVRGASPLGDSNLSPLLV